MEPKNLDYSTLSDEELGHIANGRYDQLSDNTLQALQNDPTAAAPTTAAEPKESDMAANRAIGAGIGASGAKYITPAIGGYYALEHKLSKGAQTLGSAIGEQISKNLKPSVTVEAAPDLVGGEKWLSKLSGGQYIPGGQMAAEDLAQARDMARTIGRGGELAGGENVGGVMVGPKSAAQTRAESAAAKEAQIVEDAQKRAAEYLASKEATEEVPSVLNRVGKFLTPGGLPGKVLTTAAPVFSLAGAGALGADAIERAAHNDYGRAIVSGLGALGSAASMFPFPLARGLGTGAALAAPVINYGLDALLGRDYAQGGAVQSYADGGQYPKSDADEGAASIGRPTLSSVLQGYTPPTDSPMTSAVVEHIKSLPQKFEQNQADQMALLNKAFPGDTYESMMTQGDPKALAELGMQVPVVGSTKIVRASEALAPHEGKWLNTTQSDRMRSTEGDLGGPGFSRFQQVDPAYEDAAWGVGKQSTASGIINLNKRFPEGQAIWSPMIGAETQHHSNQHVYDALTNEFNRQAASGALTPELRAEMNARLTQYPEYAPLFQGGIDVANPEHLAQLGNTFDRRGAISTVLSGKGVGGKKGQIFDYPGIMQEMTDPMTVGSPTHSVGTRLFTLNNEVSHRPDLHSAFPYILHGEDQGVAFTPVPKELAIPDWLNLVHEFKGRPAGYMDFTRGLKGKGTPNQLITEEYLRRLEDAGHKDGGSI